MCAAPPNPDVIDEGYPDLTLDENNSAGLAEVADFKVLSALRSVRLRAR
jgi:hypothetical protein